MQGAATAVEGSRSPDTAHEAASERSTIRVALAVQPIASRAARIADALGDGRAINEWVEVD